MMNHPSKQPKEAESMDFYRFARKKKRVLLSFIGTADPNCKWATIGDFMAVYNVARTLHHMEIPFDIAWVHNFLEFSDRCVDVEAIDDDQYGIFVYICGPIHEGLSGLFQKFRNQTRIAVGVSVMAGDNVEAWFDFVVPRDSLDRSTFDLALADVGWPHIKLDERYRRHDAAVCFVGELGEYGVGNSLHETAHSNILNGFREMGCATPIRIDTLLAPSDPNMFPAEINFQSTSLIGTTRLHGSLIALYHMIPFVAVDQIRNGGKLSRTVGQTGWPVILAERCRASDVANSVRDLRKDPLRTKLLLEGCRNDMIRRARNALDEAAECIKEHYKGL
jgi:hypothetical protein